MKSRLQVVIATLFLSSANLKAQTTVAEATGVYPSANISLINSFDPMFMFSFYQDLGQTFKASASATLSTVEFYVYNINTPGSINVEIYSCSGPTSWGTLLNTLSSYSINSSGWQSVDISSLNIPVTSGSYYGFRLIPQFGLDVNAGVNANDYADGQSWASHGPSFELFQAGWDLSFKVSGTNTTLPVKLTSFTAQKQDKYSLLQWSTAAEYNAKQFTIQHSTDGNRWNNVGTVAAAGNSNVPVNYSYMHSNPVAGMNYYRLLQTDIDGKASYSMIRTVKFNDNNSFTVLQNPVANGRLLLQLTDRMDLLLYNTCGNLVWKGIGSAGTSNIDVSNLSKGLYLLKAKGQTQKVLLQ